MRSLFALIVLLLVPAAAEAITVKTVDGPQGVETWLSEEHSFPMIAVNVSFPAGSAYDAAANLPQGFATGAKIDITPWKFRKPVQVTKAGAQQLELDPDVLARAMPDLRDLRVVSEEVQLPYLIERTSINRTVTLTAGSANDSERPNVSRWQLKLPQAAIPITRITCATDSSLFERTFRIWEELTDERGDKYAGELAQATWRRVPNQPAGQLAAALERTPRSDTILIETDNGDNPPIELHDFRGYYPATRVIFTSAKSQPTALYYGNDEAAPRPVYVNFWTRFPS